MNRRSFLGLLGLGVAGVMLEEAIPLGRVWSFPSEIAIAIAPRYRNELLTVAYVSQEALRILEKNLTFDRHFHHQLTDYPRKGEVQFAFRRPRGARL